MTLALPANFAYATTSAGLPVGPEADYFTLSGDRSPGKCEIEDGDAEQGWEVRKGFALMWATIVPAGEELTTLVCRIDLWTGQHYQDWLAFAAKYLSRPAPAQPGTTQPKSYGFSHIIASAPPYNVTSVVVRKVTFLKQVRPGLFSAYVYLLEWKPPIPAPPRPDQSTPPVQGGLPSAEDALGAEQNEATQELLSLEQTP